MKQSERKAEILGILHENEAVSVLELASRFRVAPMTIRRDLTELERKGFLTKQYGGAVKVGSTDPLFNFVERQGVHKVEKKEIGKRAAALVDDNDTIFIDCGTTPYQLVPHLFARKNIRVITNSLPVVMELIRHPSAKTTFIGGEIISERRASYGRLAEKALGQFTADKSFIGADGVSLSGDLSVYDEREGHLARLMIKRSGSAYLVCDSSKFGKDSFFSFGSIELLKGIVTDSRMDPVMARHFRATSVPLMLATST